MDDLDRRLLGAAQDSVPLVREPYGELARRLGCRQEQVLERLAGLRGPAGVIREISAIFAAAALGYDQALAAMRVPAGRLDEAGALAASHPGVSHCYGRAGEVNLWLTLAVSPRSRLGLAGTAAAMAAACGAGEPMVLPTLRRYKLHVRFGEGAVEEDTEESAAPAAPAALPGAHPPEVRQLRPPAPSLTDEQVRAVRALQLDLPTRRDPFAPLAAAEGLDADMLLVHGADFLAAGWMRRYAAVLRHRAVGSAANVLVAWAVPPAFADLAGGRCALIAAVSHCYLRPAAPDWPYNVYTMVHGRSEEDCRMTIEEIATVADLHDRQELWTAREYKKRRVRLLTEDEAAWEARYGGGLAC